MSCSSLYGYKVRTPSKSESLEIKAIIESGDASQCLKSKTLTRVADLCIRKYAILKKDVSACEHFRKDNNMTDYAICIGKVARAVKNKNLCSKYIKKENFRRTCRRSYAPKKQLKK